MLIFPFVPQTLTCLSKPNLEIVMKDLNHDALNEISGGAAGLPVANTPPLFVEPLPYFVPGAPRGPIPFPVEDRSICPTAPHLPLDT